jgi:hypothetical protein
VKAARQKPTSSPADNGTPANGSGRPSPTSGKVLGDAPSALIKEAQRVARLKGMTVAQVVDRAAKGGVTFSGLQRLTAEGKWQGPRQIEHTRRSLSITATGITRFEANLRTDRNKIS